MHRRSHAWGAAAGDIDLQVADFHNPLLSLSRCADLGYKSCLGNTCGHVLDHETGEAIPLARKGNLYTLRVWVRAARTGHAFTFLGVDNPEDERRRQS